MNPVLPKAVLLDLVEGEMGVGKPDARIYRLALRELDVDAREAWMVGDNLEWDVASPQKLGLFGVWIDVKGRGVPATSSVRPDRVIGIHAGRHGFMIENVAHFIVEVAEDAT